MRILEEEREWISAKQYATEPEYLALTEAILNLPKSENQDAEPPRNLIALFHDLTTQISQKFSTPLLNVEMVVDVCIASVGQIR
jgi:hypothetical protein